MSQIERPLESIAETFLPIVFENEAKGILADLLMQPALAIISMSFTELESKAAIDHVIGILQECYRDGHLKVVVAQNEGYIHGYAMFFVHPNPSFSLYCHKIYVFEQYRGHKIGTQLLEGVLQNSQSTTLLCSHDLIPFYERAGLGYKGDFTPPAASEGFAHTRGMYSGLALMGTVGAEGDAPIFMLNDNDVKNIISIIGTDIQ